MTDIAQQTPRFCGQCGAALPPRDARFCVECGSPVDPDAAAPETAAAFAPATGPTVRLPNARGEQSVVGGTVRLPSSGAIPPGLWFAPEPPGADDIVALYVPLRAVVGGWSATTSDGWRKLGQAWANDGTSRDLVRFEATREWFAAAGCAEDLRLRVRLCASSFAEEGRTRRGFRYRIGTDPPMEVVDAWWVRPDSNRRFDLPVPQIQLMAPPRVRRVSDYAEPIRQLNGREAELWAAAGQVRGLFRMPDASQQRTLVGRGIPLFEVPDNAVLRFLTGQNAPLHRVQLLNPLVCVAGDWEPLAERIQRNARDLGLDLETDAVIEWWLDRQGYDGALFERGAHPHGGGRMVVAFRRTQIAQILPD